MDLEIRVQPRASRDHIEVQEGPRLKVYVTAAPEGGKANDAVVALVAKRLRVPKTQVEIVRGHKGRDKVVRIPSLSAEEVAARLASER